MPDRQQHRQEVQAFLQKEFSTRRWEFTLPPGSGNETYFAHGGGSAYFVKLGAHAARYQAMAALGLTPPVLASGCLEDGTALVVQRYLEGRKPSRKDYRIFCKQIAATIRRMHRSPEVRQVLPQASCEYYESAGMEALNRLRQRWERYKAQVPEVAEFVDESLAALAQQVRSLRGAGLVASHNDLCNANWIITTAGQIYLIDLESLSLDDPACDIGATLWWYYPPELRRRFLEVYGYTDDEQFRIRMRVRMALHCLAITLPRERSFDIFDPGSFAGALTDFKAVLAGEENPQGYAR